MVVTALDANQAIFFLRGGESHNSYGFDLVITDLNMPGINGYQLALSLRRGFKFTCDILLHTSDFYAEPTSDIKAVIAKGDVKSFDPFLKDAEWPIDRQCDT